MKSQFKPYPWIFKALPTFAEEGRPLKACNIMEIRSSEYNINSITKMNNEVWVGTGQTYKVLIDQPNWKNKYKLHEHSRW